MPRKPTVIEGVGSLEISVPDPLDNSSSEDYAMSIPMELWDNGEPISTPSEHFSIPDVVHTGFRPKSTFFPTSSKGPYVETYYQATCGI